MNRGILPDLTRQMRDQMTRFVQTELMGAPWTGWMRALAKRPVGFFFFFSRTQLFQMCMIPA